MPAATAYSQGWLLGDGAPEGRLVPFELAARPGRGAASFSGPVAADVFQSLLLARWAVEVCLTRLGRAVAATDVHLNFPLHRLVGAGPSCRLPFVYSLLEVMSVELAYAADDVVLSGDLTLGGDVLAVGGFERKFRAAREAGITHVFAAADQTPRLPEVVGIAHIAELAGRA